MVELTVLRGRNVVAKDFNGLSDPYLVVKYGTEVIFRTRVIHKMLSPQWNDSATLSSPHPDEIIRVWCCLEHVKTGEILLRIKKIVPKESIDWSHLDEASRPLVEGSGGQVGSTTSPSGKSLSSIPEKQERIPPPLRRRHTLAYTQSLPPSSDPLASHSHDDSSLTELPSKPPSSDTRADIHRAQRGGIDLASLGHVRSSGMSSLGSRSRQTMYCNIAGQVVEADGIKGELDWPRLAPGHEHPREAISGPLVLCLAVGYPPSRPPRPTQRLLFLVT